MQRGLPPFLSQDVFFPFLGSASNGPQIPGLLSPQKLYNQKARRLPCEEPQHFWDRLAGCPGGSELEGSGERRWWGVTVTALLLVSGCSRRSPDGPGTELHPRVAEEV